ncbi:type II secretion system F family protein [Patescibacteria group bacterium]|nr:type II secretion system F family protein [Patescibacteria group bacterium]MBU1970566.1 type II secretion system F family protein [Patescibacteria group bacterium]
MKLFSAVLRESRVSESEVALFTRQFATMVAAGLSVSRCLAVLIEQASNPKFKEVISDIQTQVTSGVSLHAAFSKYPLIFPNAYIALCNAGESSGKLDEILLKLADTLEKDKDIKTKFKTALIYPCIILVAMMGVFVLMMVAVVPKLAELYETMNVDLPFITKIMIGISDFMVNYVFILLPLAFGGFFLLKYFMQTLRGRELAAEFLFALPVIGPVNVIKEYTLFSRTLSTLLNAGVAMVESLTICGDVVTNLGLKQGVKDSTLMVERGVPLSEAMDKSAVFPAMLYKMVEVGEETGKVDSVLERVSIYYANETETAVARLSAALEPFLLIFLGVGVGILILSIITPIYKITTAI